MIAAYWAVVPARVHACSRSRGCSQLAGHQLRVTSITLSSSVSSAAAVVVADMPPIPYTVAAAPSLLDSVILH